MKIVIDIDENVYTRLFDNGTETNKEDRKVIDVAIRNGTPLPKGHGRLIDADALVAEWKNGFHKKMVEALMDDAPTIIEADGGVQNDK